MACQLKQCTVMLTKFTDADFRRDRLSTRFHVMKRGGEHGTAIYDPAILDRAQRVIEDLLEEESKSQPEGICRQTPDSDPDCKCTLVTEVWGAPEEIEIFPWVPFTVNGTEYFTSTTVKRHTGTGTGWCRDRSLKRPAPRYYFVGALGSVSVTRNEPLSDAQMAVVLELTGAKLLDRSEPSSETKLG